MILHPRQTHNVFIAYATGLFSGFHCCESSDFRITAHGVSARQQRQGPRGLAEPGPPALSHTRPWPSCGGGGGTPRAVPTAAPATQRGAGGRLLRTDPVLPSSTTV